MKDITKKYRIKPHITIFGDTDYYIQKKVLWWKTIKICFSHNDAIDYMLNIINPQILNYEYEVDIEKEKYEKLMKNRKRKLNKLLNYEMENKG